MNNILKSAALVISLFCATLIPLLADAQLPAPPPPPGSHGTNTNSSPLGAPIDGGMTIFLAFAAVYSGREWMKGKMSAK